MPLLHHCGSGEPNHPIGYVVGCGGAGCHALHSVPHLSRFEPVAVNDLPHPSMAGIPKRLMISKEGLRGLAEVDDSVLRELRSEGEKRLADLLGRPDLVFVVAGLGGEMGSWASNVAVRVARRIGAATFAVVNLPFSAEGPGRQANAREALKLLQTRADGIATFPNEAMSKIAPNLPFGKAFEVLGHFMAQPMAMVSAVLTLSDLSLLRRSLRRAGEIRFGAGESSVLDHPETLALEEAFRSPWIDRPLERSTVALLVVEGDLGPRQVEGLAATCATRLPAADVFVGAVHREGREVSVRLLAGFV